MHHTQKGFTLLEAVVAMVLIASSGIALLSWINSNLVNLRRVEANYIKQKAIQNSVAFLQGLNPHETPTGEKQVGSYRIHWHAVLIDEVKEGRYLSGGGQGLYQVGLYDTQVTVFIGKSKEVSATYSVRLLGYKQVRRPELY